MTTPRVLFADTYPFDVGGAQMTVAELATRLSDRFDVATVTVAEGAAAQYWRAAGLPVHVLPYPASLRRWQGTVATTGRTGKLRSARDALRHARMCAALLRAEKIDVLYCSNLRTVLTFGIGARLARVPSIWYVQQLETPVGRAHVVAGRIVTRVASLSARVDRVFPHGLPRDRSVVIPLGLDLTHWTTPDSASPTPPPLALVCVGRTHPDKGIDVVLDAMALLRQRGVPTTLRIIGSPTNGTGRGDEDRLREQSRSLGLDDAVEWYGQTDDVRGALSPVHLLVSGSRREGLPRSIMEAMVLGIPAVATDVGAVRDLVIDDVTGRVVPADDPSALADALATYAADPSLIARHGEAAQTHIRTNFDLERTVTMFADELAALARRRS